MIATTAERGKRYGNCEVGSRERERAGRGLALSAVGALENQVEAVTSPYWLDLKLAKKARTLPKIYN